jgi:hypothetical protein
VAAARDGPVLARGRGTDRRGHTEVSNLAGVPHFRDTTRELGVSALVLDPLFELLERADGTARLVDLLEPPSP